MGVMQIMHVMHKYARSQSARGLNAIEPAAVGSIRAGTSKQRTDVQYRSAV